VNASSKSSEAVLAAARAGLCAVSVIALAVPFINLVPTRKTPRRAGLWQKIRVAGRAGRACENFSLSELYNLSGFCIVSIGGADAPATVPPARCL
jgi:hypothetical protein